MASLEGGIGSVATASGQAAEFLTITTLAGTGDHVVSGSSIYGGSYTLLATTLRRLGIHTTFVANERPEEFEAAIGDRTKVVYTEIIGNPTGAVADVEALADIAHRHGLPLRRRCDIRHPVPLPPDRVRGRHRSAFRHQVHRGPRHEYRWRYHGGRNVRLGGFGSIRPTDRAGRHLQRPALVGQLRGVRLLHGGPGPNSCEMSAPAFPRSTPSFCCRAWRRSRSVWMPTSPMLGRVSAWLAGDRRVSWVAHADLADSPYHDLATRYLPKGAGAIFTFGIEGGRTAGQRFIESLQMVSHLANVGDARTLVIHPASTTHPADERLGARAGRGRPRHDPPVSGPGGSR